MKVDLSQGEIPEYLVSRDGTKRPNPDYPVSLICKSGHKAPPHTRFFAVSGSTLSEDRKGLYCELCLIVANKHKNLVKLGKAENFNFLEELDFLIKERTK